MLRHVLDAAGDLLLGASCPGCGRPGFGLCAGCGALLLDREVAAVTPDPVPPGFPACTSTGAYDPLLRNLLVAHKEHQALLLGPVLGRLLADAVAPLLRVDEPTLLVPVPSTPAAVRRRGLDATLALAGRAAALLRREGYTVTARRTLRIRRAVADQSGLGVAARARNVSGAYEVRWGVRREVPEVPVVVVDDLVTTGASLLEATRALTAGGLAVRGAAVVAATERTHRRRPR